MGLVTQNPEPAFAIPLANISASVRQRRPPSKGPVRCLSNAGVELNPSRQLGHWLRSPVKRIKTSFGKVWEKLPGFPTPNGQPRGEGWSPLAGWHLSMPGCPPTVLTAGDGGTRLDPCCNRANEPMPLLHHRPLASSTRRQASARVSTCAMAATISDSVTPTSTASAAHFMSESFINPFLFNS